MKLDASRGRLPLDYFALVFILAIPFWLFGGGRLPLPMNLPVGALATLVPATAAAILAFRRRGPQGVRELFRRAVDYRKIKRPIWYLPALLLMPLIYSLSYLIMRLTGAPLPESIRIPWLIAPVLFVMFFIGDSGEELGWTGYAIDPMQERWGDSKAAVLLGMVWAIWHVIPYVQTHHTATWIAWRSLWTVALRVLIVWIYNESGKSVFAATLVHVMDNVSWSLFPNYGSHLDPVSTTIIAWLFVVIVVWGKNRRRRPSRKARQH